MKAKARTMVWLLVITAGALAPAGCTGTIYPEDNVGPSADDFLIQQLGLSGTTEDACAVTVEDVTDGDAVDDLQWRVDFTLDDKDAADSLPADTGKEQRFVFRILANRTSDGQVYRKKVTLTLYD